MYNNYNPYYNQLPQTRLNTFEQNYNRNILQGRSVDSIDVVKAVEVPLDGSISYYPLTDGTAILGLGDIGPEAGMPVMEGKCVLFKEFGDVDAIPLCIRSKDVDTIVDTISLLAGSFSGINLEDIAAPRCFEIEKKLKEKCDIYLCNRYECDINMNVFGKTDFFYKNIQSNCFNYKF